MNPRPKSLEILPNQILKLVFSNGEIRFFDVAAYIRDIPALHGLNNPVHFAQAQIAHGTVAWSDYEDICPDTLYLSSTPDQQKTA